MAYIYYDTETCGFNGLASLLQYAEDDGPVVLHHIWRVPIKDTLQLLEYMMTHVNVAFNQVFDHFQLQKLWTTFHLAESMLGGDAIPIDHRNEIGVLEEQARFVDFCLKPRSALDLLLYSRKGPYQSLMRRKPISIRKVPVQVAEMVRKHLEDTVTFDKLYGATWTISPKITDPAFRDLTITFKASTSLKALAYHVLGKKDVINYKEVMPKPPAEVGYAPFALAIAKPPFWIVRVKGKKTRKFAWPKLMRMHSDHWYYSDMARQYATDDVLNTRDLHRHYLALDPKDCEHGDDDSILACQVACVRWRGFAIDIPRIQELRTKAAELHKDVPTSPKKARAYITETMEPIEKLAVTTTKATALEDIIREFEGEEPGIRAAQVKARRSATKVVEVCDKLLQAGRLHASFNIIGAKSSRMSGRDKLNPQGMNRDPELRECFTLADPGFTLSGGDFDAFEVVLTDAVYQDPKLNEELKSGKKIHALFAAKMFPEYDYDYIIANKRTPFLGTSALYDLGKNGVFSMIYFGNWETLVKKYKVAEENAKNSFEGFLDDHPVLRDKREDIVRRFCTLQQEGKVGTKVSYTEPDEYISTMFGFRRWFTLENELVRQLLHVASKPPKEWSIPGDIVRRDRVQSVRGAVTSALYGTIFGVQGQNMRAGGNHIIQSPGATITKSVQRRIWDRQPVGIHPFLVLPMNVHDEILCPTRIPDEVAECVNEAVEDFRPQVPLIKLEWEKEAESWGKLKG